jgi:predicted SAM-dependent methyltransferase
LQFSTPKSEEEGMLRRLIDSIANFMCWIKRNRIITPKGEVVKLNIGSGLSVAPGWINVDASLNAFFSKLPRFVLKILYRISESKQWYSQKEYCDILRSHIFVYHNVEYGLPFPDQSVDYLYCSHLLDFLFKEDAKKFMEEAYRVLKENGVFRICVTDLEYPLSLYSKRHTEEALSYFFPASKRGYFSRRRYMYNFDLLRHLLKEAGFTNIERCSYRHGKTRDIDVLDNRPEQTLYVEASKNPKISQNTVVEVEKAERWKPEISYSQIADPD